MNSLASLDAKFMRGYESEILTERYHVKESEDDRVLMNGIHRYYTFMHDRVLRGIQLVKVEEE